MGLISRTAAPRNDLHEIWLHIADEAFKLPTA